MEEISIRRFLAEFLGTYALVFCGTGAIVINEVSNGVVGNTGIALTFGLIVASMIYSFGNISGAHINPAVTLAFWLKREIGWVNTLGYVGVQISGAVLASVTLRVLFPEATTLGETIPSGPDYQSFVLEFILTYFLMLVIVQVSNGPALNRPLAGLVIGGVVALEAAFAGPVCGASMNPARSIGPALVIGNTSTLWIYLLAPVLGAIAAMFTGKVLSGQNKRLT